MVAGKQPETSVTAQCGKPVARPEPEKALSEPPSLEQGGQFSAFESRMIERDRLRMVIRALNAPPWRREGDAQDFAKRHGLTIGPLVPGTVVEQPQTRHQHPTFTKRPFVHHKAKRHHNSHPSKFSCADRYGTKAYQYGKWGKK